MATLRIFLLLGGCLPLGTAWATPPPADAAWQRIALHGSELQGELGRRLRLEVAQNFLALDLEKDFLAPFQHPQPPEAVLAHFGANAIELGENVDAAVWLTSATGDPQVAARKEVLIRGTLAAQAPSGYIGVYLEEPQGRQLFRNYTLEDCSYLIVGLVDNYRLFGDAASLAGARRLAEFILSSWPFRPAGVKFSSVGFSQAFLTLYEATQDSRFLRFAADTPDGGLFNDPGPLRTWKQELYPSRPLDYVGARLARALPRGLYPEIPAYTYPSDRVHVYALLERTIAQMRLGALEGSDGPGPMARTVWQGLTDSRRPGLVVTGAAGWMEAWNEDQDGQGPLGETCASVHLLWFFEQWLRQTGDLRCGDLMERTIYNTLFAAQEPAGRRLRYFTSFSGERRYFELDTYCCPGNFRRGLGLLPSMVYYRTPSGFAINLYNESATTQPLADGTSVTLSQATDYPASGRVEISVGPARPERFSLRLRIPAWCRRPLLALNGVPVAATPRSGTVELDRTWSPGDRLTLELPMEWRWVKGLGMQTGRAVLMRGPLVYGLDPLRNSAAAGLKLRDLIVDPASLGEASPDPLLRPGAISVALTAWKPGAEKSPPGEAERKRLDRANTGPAAGEKGSAALPLVFTEFSDPGEEEIYFRLPPSAHPASDELLRPL